MSTRIEFATKIKDRGFTKDQAIKAFDRYRELNGEFDDEIVSKRESPKLDMSLWGDVDKIRTDFLNRQDEGSDPVVNESNFQREFVRNHYMQLDSSTDYSNNYDLSKRGAMDFKSEDIGVIYSGLRETYSVDDSFKGLSGPTELSEGVKPTIKSKIKHGIRNRYDYIKHYVKGTRELTKEGQEELRGGNAFVSKARSGRLTGGMIDHFQQGGWDNTQNLKATNAGNTLNRDALRKIQAEDREIGTISSGAMNLSQSSFGEKAIKGATGSLQNMGESMVISIGAGALNPALGKVATTAYWQRQGAGTFIRSAISDRNVDDMSDDELKTMNNVSQSIAIPYALVELAVSSIPGVKGAGFAPDKLIADMVVRKIARNPSILKKLSHGSTSFVTRWLIEGLIEEGTQGGLGEVNKQIVDGALESDASLRSALQSIDLGRIAKISKDEGVGALPATMVFSALGIGGDIKVNKREQQIFNKKVNLIESMPLTREQKDDVVETLDDVSNGAEFEEWFNNTVDLALDGMDTVNVTERINYLSENDLNNGAIGDLETSPEIISELESLWKHIKDTQQPTANWRTQATEIINTISSENARIWVSNPVSKESAMDTVLTALESDVKRAEVANLMDNGDFLGAVLAIKTPTDKLETVESPTQVSNDIDVDVLADMLVDEWQDTSVFQSALEGGYNTLHTPYTVGQFEELKKNESSLINALNSLDPASVELMLSAMNGDTVAQKKWNDLAKMRVLEQKDGILTDAEKKQITQFKVDSLKAQLSDDVDLKEIDEAALKTLVEFDVDKDKVSFITNVIGWSGGLGVLNRLTPKLATAMQEYVKNKSTIYNGYFENEPNIRRAIQGLTKIDKIIARMDKTGIHPKLVEEYKQSVLDFHKGQNVDSLSDTLDAMFLATRYDSGLSKVLNNQLKTLRVIDEKFRDMYIYKKTNNHTPDSVKTRDLFKPMLNSIVRLQGDSGTQLIVKRERIENFIDRVKKLDPDRKITSTSINDGVVKLDDMTYKDLDLFYGIFESLDKKLKAKSELESRAILLGVDMGDVDIKYKTDGSIDTVGSISLDNLRDKYNLNELSPKARVKIEGVVGHVINHKQNTKTYKVIKTLAIDKISQYTTAMLQGGDIGKTYSLLNKMVGSPKALKLIGKQLGKQFINNNIITTIIKDVKKRPVGETLYVLNESSKKPINNKGDSNKETLIDKIDLTSIGGDIFDIDLEVSGEAQLNYWTYLLEAVKDQRFAWQTRESVGKFGVEAVKSFWNKGQLSLLQHLDLNMKDLTINASAEAIMGMPYDKRVETLTELFRGDYELAVKVSDDFDGDVFSQEVKGTLFNLLNTIQPLSAMDRAELFLSHPEYGMFQSFASKQTAILYDRLFGNISKSIGYRKTGMKSQENLENALKEYDKLDTVDDKASYNYEKKQEINKQINKYRKQRAYSADKQTEYMEKTLKHTADFMLFYIGIDIMFQVAIDSIKGLGDDDRETLTNNETSSGEYLLRKGGDALLNVLIPVVSIGFLVDNGSFGKNSVGRTIFEDVLKPVLPTVVTVSEEIIKAVESDDDEKLLKLTRRIPFVGTAIYDIMTAVNN